MGNSSIKRVLKFVANLDEFIGYAALAGLTIFTAINVVLRYFFQFTISAAEELSLITFIWASYLGIAAAFKVDEHIAIDIFINMLPPKARKVADIIIMAFLTLLSGVYTYYSFLLTINTGAKASRVLSLSYVYINVVLVIGFGLMTIYGVIKIVRLIQGKSTKLHDTGMVDILEAVRAEREAEAAADAEAVATTKMDAANDEVKE